MEEKELTVAAGKKVFIFRIINYLSEKSFEEIKSDIANGINRGVVILEPEIDFIGCFDIGGGEKSEP